MDMEPLYGPPPALESSPGSEPSEDIDVDMEPLYGPPSVFDYEPAEDIPEDIYGPPVGEEDPMNP